MPFIATPARRQLAMAAMLALAVAGGVIRYQAPDPSVLRDVGSLLLVMWLPAVGNLMGYLMRKLPRSKPPPTHFAAGSPFLPHLRVRLELLPLPSGLAASLGQQDDRATLLGGRRGFTVRLDRPVAQWLAEPPGDAALECLVPAAALRALPPGAPIHLLVGTTAVAKGHVLEQLPALTESPLPKETP